MVRTFPPIGLLNLTESYKLKSGITSFILHSGCRGFFIILPLFLYHKPWVFFQSLPSLNFFITSLKTNSPSYLQITLILGLLKQISGALIGNTPSYNVWYIILFNAFKHHICVFKSILYC